MQLRALGVEPGAQVTKKALLPSLLDMLKSPPTPIDQVDWSAAPPLALPAPSEPEPPSAVAQEPGPSGMPLAAAPDEPSRVHSTPTKPAEKRVRRGRHDDDVVAP